MEKTKDAATMPWDGSLRRVTSAPLMRCMNRLEQVREEEEREKGVTEDVHLTPVLVWDHKSLGLEATVGRERQYVVRNLQDFCRALMEEDVLTFGKGLSFRAGLGAFDQDSRPLAEFLLRQYRQLYELRLAKSGYRADELAQQLFERDGRAMILTPQTTDQLMELLDGRRFPFEKKERYLYSHANGYRHSEREPGFTSTVKVQAGEPLLTLSVEEAENGILLRSSGLTVRCSGKDHMYVIGGEDNDILWKTGRAYLQKMSVFLETMEQSDHEIFVAKEDMTRFCVNIYTVLRDWLDIRGDETLLERYMPWDVEGQLYLDSPRAGVITARLYGDYGPTKVNLYNQKWYRGDELPSERTEISFQEAEAMGVKRSNAEEIRLCHLVEPYITDVDLDGGMLVIRDDNDRIYDFLKRGQAELAPQFRMFVTDRYKRLMFPAKAKMAAGVSLSGDLLKVTFDLEGFPPEELSELLAAYRVKRRYYRLKSGQFLSMEDGEVRDAMELAAGLQLTGEEMRAGQAQLPRYRALYVDEMAKQARYLTVHRAESFTDLLGAIRNVEQSKLRVPDSLQEILREYQKTGYRWLKTMASQGFGGILADDMGLGKTLEVIALLLSASQEELSLGSEEEILGLVICPASLVWNWAGELQRFAPQLQAVSVSGTAAVRKKQIHGLTELPAEQRHRTVVLTSYDLLKRDVELYEELCFSYHIVDEAQYIKNFTTKNAKAVNALHSVHRFALTGTPIENRLSDLWSIFNFLMPGYLGSYMQFRRQYERPILEEQDQAAGQLLQNQVRPFILRRLKEKVLKELPEKVETVMYIPLEGEQQKLYMGNLAKVKLEVGQTISEGSFETNRLQVLALLTRLRQLCCHPALCYDNYTGSGVKLEACMELIRQAVDGGHRILLFSQFTGMLALIEERLKKEGIGYYTLTGQTPKTARQHLVTYFNEGRVPVFLISLKAGGTGLNLTGADIVIHYDPWWNLAAQNQATDRAYRMGQKKSVQVYKLVADGTIEEKILHLQESKRDMADAVLEGMTEEDLKDLLKIDDLLCK